MDGPILEQLWHMFYAHISWFIIASPIHPVGFWGPDRLSNGDRLAVCLSCYLEESNHIYIYSPETPNLGQNRRFLEPRDLEIWRMTLKNNRAPLLCYFKLYASLSSHRCIQAGVTVWKCPIWVKIDDFLAVWPCNLSYDLERQ